MQTVRHNLRCSTIDGLFYMVMVGLAETFFPLFILTLFGSEFGSGLIATVPLLVATCLQLLAPQLVQLLRSYKTVIVLCAALQVVACFALAVAALIPHTPIGFFFLLATLYHSGAVVGGPPWTTLMSLLVPRPVRAAYFARRSRQLQLGAMVAIPIGAAFLEFAPTIGPRAARVFAFWPDFSTALEDRPTLACFAVLFAFAGVARAVSTYYLHRHIEPGDATLFHRPLSLKEAAARVRAAGTWRLLCLLLLFTFAMMIATPYWAAYVRQVGQVSFGGWAGLLVVWYVGKAATMSWAGRVAKVRGRRKLLVVSACLMSPIPVLWAVTPHPIGLVLSHFAAGAALGAWELAVTLALLDAFDDEERTSLLSLYTFGQWGASTAGSLVGGSMLERLAKDHGAFGAVFVTSTILRTVVAVLISRTRGTGLPDRRKSRS